MMTLQQGTSPKSMMMTFAKDDDLAEVLAEVAAGYLADVEEDDLAEGPSQGVLRRASCGVASLADAALSLVWL